MADLIEIPKRYRDILVGLVDMSVAAKTELNNILRLGGGVGGTNKDIIANVKFMPLEYASNLLDAITPLYFLKIRSGKDTSGVVKDVLASIESEIDEKEIDNINKKKLSKILFELLNHSETELSAKAIYLLLEQDKVYTSARILTDLRPVFGGAKISSPKAAVILHTLKLEFSENGNESSFHIALDTLDIKNLIEVLTRAKAKELELKTHIEKSGLKYIEIK